MQTCESNQQTTVKINHLYQWICVANDVKRAITVCSSVEW